MRSAAFARASANNGRPLADSSKFCALVEFARNLDLIQTVGLLTLVLTVIFGFDYWLFRIVSRICLLLFVLHPGVLRRPQLWFSLALAGTISLIVEWEKIDNHKYLLDYWMWILFIVHLFAQPERQRQVI